jgi:RNA-binding protein YhbY
LNNVSKEVDDRLQKIEQVKLEKIGKTRSEYETLADELEKSVSKI